MIYQPPDQAAIHLTHKQDGQTRETNGSSKEQNPETCELDFEHNIFIKVLLADDLFLGTTDSE